MTMTVSGFVTTQNPGGNPVDHQANHGHRNGLVEHDSHRLDEPGDAFRRHEQCKTRQQHRACEATQGVDLAGPETAALVVRVAACVDVGKCRNAQSGSVRAHVQAGGE